MHARRFDRSKRRFTATRRDYDTNPDYDDDDLTAAGRHRRRFPRGGAFGDDRVCWKLAEGYETEDDKWALDRT